MSGHVVPPHGHISHTPLRAGGHQRGGRASPFASGPEARPGSGRLRQRRPTAVRVATTDNRSGAEPRRVAAKLSGTLVGIRWTAQASLQPRTLETGDSPVLVPTKVVHTTGDKGGHLGLQCLPPSPKRQAVLAVRQRISNTRGKRSWLNQYDDHDASGHSLCMTPHSAMSDITRFASRYDRWIYLSNNSAAC